MMTGQSAKDKEHWYKKERVEATVGVMTVTAPQSSQKSWFVDFLYITSSPAHDTHQFCG